jgi:hypothetical protein
LEDEFSLFRKVKERMSLSKILLRNENILYVSYEITILSKKSYFIVRKFGIPHTFVVGRRNAERIAVAQKYWTRGVLDSSLIISIKIWLLI